MRGVFILHAYHYVYPSEITPVLTMIAWLFMILICNFCIIVAMFLYLCFITNRCEIGKMAVYKNIFVCTWRMYVNVCTCKWCLTLLHCVSHFTQTGSNDYQKSIGIAFLNSLVHKPVARDHQNTFKLDFEVAKRFALAGDACECGLLINQQGQAIFYVTFRPLGTFGRLCM